ncbi:MAG: preprotein translocase subunit SecG [Firmicutes bacterium HGW-Firmicutes-7]|nr:MAG: preprotein translocase subunit SecG [Firmicutes bacterium HGW-Firmicutes-7]
MATLVIILKVVYLLDCITLVGIVLLQQGKVTGLSGAIAGAGETYWGKNKARSMEGGLHKATVAIATLFIVLSVVLNLI